MCIYAPLVQKYLPSEMVHGRRGNWRAQASFDRLGVLRDSDQASFRSLLTSCEAAVAFSLSSFAQGIGGAFQAEVDFHLYQFFDQELGARERRLPSTAWTMGARNSDAYEIMRISCADDGSMRSESNDGRLP